MSQKITWIEPYFDIILNEIPNDSKSVLDVGTGSGVFGFIVKKTKDVCVHGIEPFDYDLSHYDASFKYTWETFHELNPDNKYDVLVSTEMIEHMEIHEAKDFLREAKAHADKVIITTPYFWHEQPAYDDNPYQVHQSLITPEIFKENGYSVSYIGTGVFPPRPKAIKKIYQNNKKKLNSIGITATPTAQSRFFFNDKLIPFYKLIGVRPSNIVAIWKKD